MFVCDLQAKMMRESLEKIDSIKLVVSVKFVPS